VRQRKIRAGSPERPRAASRDPDRKIRYSSDAAGFVAPTIAANGGPHDAREFVNNLTIVLTVMAIGY
jgi:hypothetical protein